MGYSGPVRRLDTIERLKGTLRRYRDAEPQYRRLDVSPDGVRLTSSKSGREIWAVRWDELDEIVAYKEDAGVVDHICLAFRKRGEDSFHVTDEETAGWEDLNRALTERFGIEKSRWHGGVAAPAFAENWTVLWRRAT
jgi:hypothetical protein